MATFFVIVEAGEDIVKEELRQYPDNYEYQKNVFLVRTDDIAETIANNLRIKGDNQAKDVSGAVFKLNASFAGYTRQSLWDWLTKDE